MQVDILSFFLKILLIRL